MYVTILPVQEFWEVWWAVCNGREKDGDIHVPVLVTTAFKMDLFDDVLLLLLFHKKIVSPHNLFHKNPLQAHENIEPQICQILPRNDVALM